ncbi:hypothetical protein FI667_g14488, partial [Globisporangium splendens]
MASPAGRTRQDLFRLVSALSGACRADGNLLKDSQLVDLLESQARAILQTRRQQRRKSVAVAKTAEPPTISPQRTKLIKKFANANAESGKDGVSKRRKLSFETEKQHTSGLKDVGVSPIKAALPRFFEKNPADEFLPHAASVTVFNAATIEHVSQRSGTMSPSQFYKSQVTPFKSLDRASVATDLSASMASTVTSTTPGYYDDMYDDLAVATDPRYRRYHSPSSSSRGRHSPSSELMQSVDSIDWSPTDDEDEEETKLDVTELSHAEEMKPEIAVMEPAFAVLEEPDVSVNEKQKNATKTVMQVLYGIMQHDQNYKWLINSENQERVAALVAYHQKQEEQNESPSTEEDLHAQLDAMIREKSLIQSENVRLAELNQMSACEIEEQKKRVNELILKLQRSKPVGAVSSDLELLKRLADTQEELTAQETLRREAESFFESELSAKTQMAASLQNEVVSKDAQISKLMKRVEEISANFVAKRDENADFASSRRSSLSAQKSFSTAIEPVGADENMILHLREVNIAREIEVKRLRNVLMEKDREICNLYMNLSTKKKLVDEISTRFVEQLKASGGNSNFSVEDLNLNLDMFLFKNVVEKQKTVDELTAALGVMEREVESLETRADKFESENYTLKNAQEDLTLALESANSELLRVSAENELMESSLKDKQTRVRNLMLYLEEKEDQIMRLKDATQQNLLL